MASNVRSEIESRQWKLDAVFQCMSPTAVGHFYGWHRYAPFHQCHLTGLDQNCIDVETLIVDVSISRCFQN